MTGNCGSTRTPSPTPSARTARTPARCQYRIVIDNTPGHPQIPGWTATTYRSTEGFTRHTVGTALGGGSLGAGLSYYAGSGR